LVAVAALPGAAMGVLGDEEAGQQGSETTTTPAAAPLLRSAAYAEPRPVGAGVLAPTDARPAQADDREPKTARSYAVQDVLARIREDRGLSAPESRQFLKTWLAGAVYSQRPPALPHGPYQQPARDRRDPPDMVWNGDGLLIETRAAGHQRIAEALEVLRKYGAAEIAVEVRFVTGPAEELQRAGANWTLVPSEFPATVAPENGPVLPAAFDHSLGSHDGPRPTRAQVLVEKNLPVMFEILDENHAKTLLERWQADRSGNVLQAPKVTLFNAQTAFVTDASQSPFVVGLKDGQPQIRVVSEGTFLHLRPLVDPEGKLMLDFALTFSKIREVEMVTVPGGPNKGASLQVPEVATARVEGRVELPWNKYLLLGGLEPRSPEGKPEATLGTRLKRWLLPGGLELKTPDGKPQSMLVMLRAEKVPSLGATQPATRR
jgi:hypothetical protein